MRPGVPLGRRQRHPVLQPLDHVAGDEGQIERQGFVHAIPAQISSSPEPASVPPTRAASTTRKRALKRTVKSGGVTARHR